MFLQYLTTAIRIQFQLNIIFRWEFLVKLALVIIKLGLFLFTWSFFFQKYIRVEGWNYNDLIALYGLMSFGIGFVEMFFYGVREIPSLIESNQLDNFLTQPQNVLLNVALSKGDIIAFTEVIYGVLLLLYSGYFVLYPLLVLGCLLLSVVFIFSLYLYLSSLAFFLSNAKGFIRELYQNANIVASQPNSAYKGILRLLTLTVIPVSYLSFYPVEYLRTQKIEHLAISVLGVLVFFVISCWFFYKGLSRYESGNMFSSK